MMSLQKRNWWVAAILLVFVLFLTFAPMISLAADVDGEPCDENDKPGMIKNPLGCTSTIPQFIAKVLQGLLKLGIPVVAVAFIYAGFLFVAAMGNSEKLSKAKTTFMYTLLGAAILLGAWALAELIANTVIDLAS